jgi:tRNA threonylcarbamoyl adenosine modification protein YeaZ
MTPSHEYNLLIETSLAGTCLAISNGNGKVLWSFQSEGIASSAATLGEQFKTALNDLHVRTENFQSIVLATGPGSFTGLRIGAAFALGFAEGLRANQLPIKFLGVSSLSLIAKARYAASKVPQTVWLSSTKSQGYWSHFDGKNVREDIIDLHHHEIPNCLDNTSEHVSIGPWDHLSQKIPSVITITNSNAIRLTFESMAQKVFSAAGTEFEQMLPPIRYLRKSTVEEKLELSAQK